MTPVDENTSGREEARRAVEESQRLARKADRLIATTRGSLGQMRHLRETNHFTEKFRKIIQGAV